MAHETNDFGGHRNLMQSCRLSILFSPPINSRQLLLKKSDDANNK